MKKDSKIYVAGHKGLVGSALMRKLNELGYSNIITATHKELDLLNQKDTFDYLRQTHPDYVFIAAAKVGGIVSNNTYRAQFLYENMTISANITHGSYLSDVKKLIFLGSSCIYPRLAPQPIEESSLLSSSLEFTNEPYAISKIAGLKMCENYNRQYGTNFISVMPTNLYGPNDNYDPDNSHVFPAFIRRIHESKLRGDKYLDVWGTGNPRREFLHVDDAADAIIHVMNNYDENEIINIGCGVDVSIRELAETMKEIIGFDGKLKFDVSKPDGTPRKLLNVNKLFRLDWRPKITLAQGIEMTYQSFLDEYPRWK